MHDEAYKFVRSATGAFDTVGKRVLEIGSYNVNGSVRELFKDASEYVGIDAREGRGVDLVCSASAFEATKPFDIVVTTEALEHSPRPADIIECAYRSLKEGGILIITAAGPDRKPHGNDGGELANESYTPIDKEFLTGLLKDWSDVSIQYGRSHNQARGDIYAVATKPKTARKAKAKKDDIEAEKAAE
jgi:SAM-dependent methyltransferase